MDVGLRTPAAVRDDRPGAWRGTMVLGRKSLAAAMLAGLMALGGCTDGYGYSGVSVGAGYGGGYAPAIMAGAMVTRRPILDGTTISIIRAPASMSTTGIVGLIAGTTASAPIGKGGAGRGAVGRFATSGADGAGAAGGARCPAAGEAMGRSGQPHRRRGPRAGAAAIAGRPAVGVVAARADADGADQAPRVRIMTVGRMVMTATSS